MKQHCAWEVEKSKKDNRKLQVDPKTVLAYSGDHELSVISQNNYTISDLRDTFRHDSIFSFSGVLGVSRSPGFDFVCEYRFSRLWSSRCRL
jgi:hypothetical protein